MTLLSEPGNDRYRLREDAVFGESVHIPAPFGFVLDTTGLLPYRPAGRAAGLRTEPGGPWPQCAAASQSGPTPTETSSGARRS